MRTKISHGLFAAAFTVLYTLISTITAFAGSITGGLEPVDGYIISGWAADNDHPDKTLEVALYLFTDGADTAKELATVTVKQKSGSVGSADNEHNQYTFNVDWDKVEGTEFQIQAFALVNGQPSILIGTTGYSKTGASDTGSADSSQIATGPAATARLQSASHFSDSPIFEKGKRGEYIGSFVTTAYCGCSICSPGSGHTYAGTVPQPDHTISADIDLYPIGTTMMIGNTIYTVEDIGGSVKGNKLDIYYSSHENAVNYGVKTVDAYTVEYAVKSK